jgi:hypothetical protein
MAGRDGLHPSFGKACATWRVSVITMPIEGPGDPGNQPLDPHGKLPDAPARPGRRDQRRSAAIGPASLRLRIRPRNGGSACSTALCTGAAGERTVAARSTTSPWQQQLRRSGGVRCHTRLGCRHRTGHAQRRKAYPSPGGEVRPLLKVSGNRQKRVVFSLCPCYSLVRPGHRRNPPQSDSPMEEAALPTEEQNIRCASSGPTEAKTRT